MKLKIFGIKKHYHYSEGKKIVEYAVCLVNIKNNKHYEIERGQLKRVRFLELSLMFPKITPR